MSNKSDNVKRWRRNTKELAIKALGSKCCVCGYDRCLASMDFHHIDPITKKFTISSCLAHPCSWTKIVEELRKCVILCSNCHGELHHGELQIPENVLRFDETFAVKDVPNIMDDCPVCGKQKYKSQITCSYICSGKRIQKVNWDDIDLKNLINSNKSYVDIGELLGCSDSAVIKRAKKLGIYVRKQKPSRFKLRPSDSHRDPPC